MFDTCSGNIHISRMDGGESWLDGLDWTPVEETSSSLAHSMDGLLLPSEDIITEGCSVVLVNSGADGTLFVTNYRLIFVCEERKVVIPLGTIPLAAIEKIYKQPTRSAPASRARERGPSRRLLQVVGKDMRTIVFSFRPHTKQRRDVHDALSKLMRPTRLWDLYAFTAGLPSASINGDARQRLRAEYLRLISSPSSNMNTSMIGRTFARRQSINLPVVEDKWWRLSEVNKEYNLCATYPSLLVMPSSVSDEDIQQAATFRARGRLPALCWRHPENGAVLARSSQPLVGLMMNSRSNADEKLVAALCTPPSKTLLHRRKLYIADARPRKNALANGAMGGGSESSANYAQSEVVFMNIENIHAMRDSLGRLREYLDLHGAASSDGSSSLLRSGVWAWGGGNVSSVAAAVSALGDSGWLMHVHAILAGAAWVAARIAVEGASVLVHCSDGWDRTTQLISLAGIMLDPYYRTFQGFQALVEKDWLAFGHPFADRLGMPTYASGLMPVESLRQQSLVGAAGTPPVRMAAGSAFNPPVPANSPGQAPNNSSPIITQWVDCVAQLLRLYPRAFEFSSAFLVDVMDCILSARFGNFLCNSEKERRQAGVDSCGCMWTYLERQRSVGGSEHDHFNVFYKASEYPGPLLPPPAALSPTLWPHFYLRWAWPQDAIAAPGGSLPPGWCQGGELETEARRLAQKFSSLQKARENAEEALKETAANVATLEDQVQNERTAKETAINDKEALRRKYVAMERVMAALGCRVQITNVPCESGFDFVCDTVEQADFQQNADLEPRMQGREQDAEKDVNSAPLSVSVSMTPEGDRDADSFRKTFGAEYSSSCSSWGHGDGDSCRWPQTACARMGSAFVGLRADFDALEHLSIVDCYFDSDHASNSAAAGSEHSSGSQLMT